MAASAATATPSSPPLTRVHVCYPQANLNYDDLGLDELKGVLTNLMDRLDLAKTALAKKVEKPKLVAEKCTGTFPDLPWGGESAL